MSRSNRFGGLFDLAISHPNRQPALPKRPKEGNIGGARGAAISKQGILEGVRGATIKNKNMVEKNRRGK